MADDDWMEDDVYWDGFRVECTEDMVLLVLTSGDSEVENALVFSPADAVAVGTALINGGRFEEITE